MTTRALAFDVIGTLFSLENQRPLLVALGLPESALETWFANSLRDLFALGVVGRLVPMVTVLEDNLCSLLVQAALEPPPHRIEMAIAGMGWLAPQPGVVSAMPMFREAGIRCVALSNGSRATTEALLDRAGLISAFEAVVSIDEVGLPKPRPEVYHAAAGRLGVPPGELTLISAHPWDLQGAHSAGLGTAYLSGDSLYPSCFDQPRHRAVGMTAMAHRLIKE